MPSNETKQCRKCRETLPLSSFTKRSQSKDGLDSVCRNCKAKLAEEYYSTNREKTLAQKRAYFKTECGRQTKREANKRYRQRHPERSPQVYRELDRDFPLGDRCESCGRKENLRRFVWDAKFPEKFQTLCENCWKNARSNLVIGEVSLGVDIMDNNERYWEYLRVGEF